MNKKLFLSFTLFLLLFPLFAESKKLSLSLKPLFGLRTGSHYEYVYTKSGSGDYEKLSELEWNMEPISYLGGIINLNYSIFSLNFYGLGFLPAETDIMKDSDWDYSTKTSYSVKNKYSESDNFLDNGCNFGFDFGTRFNFAKYFAIKPFVGVDFEKLTFYAKSLKAQYATPGTSYESAQKTTTYTGKTVIEYEKNTLCFWTGFDFLYKPFSFITIGFGSKVAPFVSIKSVDNHVLRSVKFYDNINDYFSALNFNCNVDYSFLKAFTLGINLSYTKFFQMFGDDSVRSTDEFYTKYSNSQASTESSYFDFSLYFTYSL